MKLRFILSEVGKGLSRNRAMSVAVVIVTFVSLLFVGIAGLSQMQVSRMKSQWYDKIEVSVYMCATNDQTPSCNNEEATEAQIGAVRDKLASAELAPYVKEVFEESKAEAYKNFIQIYGNSSLGQWTTEDMMQVSFRVKLVNPEQFSIIRDELTGSPGVSVVKDQREIVEPLFQVLGKARGLSLGLAGVMIIAAVLLITTTIRLSAMSRERETSIMRLVGALLAVGTLFVGVHVLVNQWLAQAFRWTNFIGMREVWIMSPILIIAAVLLALSASAFSLAKYTKI